MPNLNGRRFTFLYWCADKGLLARAGAWSFLRVAERKIPGRRRDDLIVEDAPLADFQRPRAASIANIHCSMSGTSRATSTMRAITRLRTLLPALAAMFTRRSGCPSTS